MTEPIRLLHFADVHIGMENYGRLDPESGLNRRVADFLDRLDTVVAYAIDHAADVVLCIAHCYQHADDGPCC